MRKDAQWMSIGQAAKYLGVSRDTLRRWEKKGKIKAVRSPTNRRYYTKKQLEEAMSGKKPEKISKPGKRVGRTPKLIITGILSFIVAAILAFLALFFFLG